MVYCLYWFSLMEMWCAFLMWGRHSSWTKLYLFPMVCALAFSNGLLLPVELGCFICFLTLCYDILLWVRSSSLEVQLIGDHCGLTTLFGWCRQGPQNLAVMQTRPSKFSMMQTEASEFMGICHCFVPWCGHGPQNLAVMQTEGSEFSMMQTSDHSPVAGGWNLASRYI